MAKTIPNEDKPSLGNPYLDQQRLWYFFFGAGVRGKSGGTQINTSRVKRGGRASDFSNAN